MDPKTLDAINPGFSDVTNIISQLVGTNPAAALMFLSNMDEEKVKRISKWSTAFIVKLNAIKNGNDSQAIDKEYELEFSGEFDVVVGDTKSHLSKVTFEDMARAVNDMTTAVKADNYLDSIMAAVSIAKLLVI